MNKKLTLAPRRVSNVIVALVGVGLVAFITFSLNALFGSRNQQPQQTTKQPESQAIQQIPPLPTTIFHIRTNYKTFNSWEEALENPDGVTLLDLTGNNLTQLPPSVWKLKNLKHLYLNSNNLTNLPSNVTQLKNLESLDLTGNPMTYEEITRIRQLIPDVHVLFLKPMNLP